MKKEGMFFICLGLFFIIILSVGLISSFSSWTKPAGDSRKTGYSPLKGNITYPKIMWEYVYPEGTSNYIMNIVAVDDINNDGIIEACTGAKDGYLRCFNALNGTEVWNYSIGSMAGMDTHIADLYNNSEKQVIQANRSGFVAIINGSTGTQIWNYTAPLTGWMYSTHTPYNFVGDEQLEILFQSTGGLYMVYNNGTSIWNYSYEGTVIDGNGGGIVIGDIDNDGEEEIILSASNDTAIINFNGTVERIGLSFPMYYSLPYEVGLSLVDVNSDDYLEIIISYEDGYMYVINSTLDLVWSKLVSTGYMGRIAVGDIDNDSKQEIVTDGYDEGVRAINAEDGSYLWEFYTLSPSCGGPSIADIDNDGELEVINVYAGNLLILNGKYGYPEKPAINIFAETHHSSPSLADVDNDGFLEIFVTGRSYDGYYPPEFRNKIVAISGGGTPPATSHMPSDILNNNSLNWKIKGKNVLGTNDIIEYIGDNSYPVIDDLIKLESLSYSLIGEDVNSDGEIELFAVNGSDIYSIYQNGSLKWSHSFSKPIVDSPLISDLDDDDIPEVLVGTNETVFLLNASTGSTFWNYTHSTDDIIYGNFYSFDMNGDNKSELFYLFEQYYYKFLVTNYTKDTLKDIMMSNYISNVPVYDFNKDGIKDMLLAGDWGAIILVRMDLMGEITSGYAPGYIKFSSLADLNKDGYMDVVVGTRNLSYAYYEENYYRSMGGENAGLFGLIYNHTIGNFSYGFYYSSANVSDGGVATSDLDDDGDSEIIFGDIENKLHVVNSTGELVWSLDLGEIIEYSPMVIREDDTKVILATSNDSVFFINSTGSVYYIYNSSSEFSYSPIVLDLNKDCNGEFIISSVDGNITSLDFSDSENSLYGEFNISISDSTYNPKSIGKGICGGVIVDVNSYDSDGVILSLEGSSEGEITLTNLTPSTRYLVTSSEDEQDTFSYIDSDSNGSISFSYIVNNLKTIDISTYVATTSHGGSSSKDPEIFVTINQDTKEVYLGKESTVRFNFKRESHKIKINRITNGKVSFSIYSTPKNYTLGVNESVKEDLDGDGFYDVEIRILSVYLSSVKLGIKNINEKIFSVYAEEETENEKANLNESNNNLNLNNKSSYAPSKEGVSSENKEKRESIYFYLSLILVLIFLIILVIYKIKSYHKRRHYYY